MDSSEFKIPISTVHVLANFVGDQDQNKATLLTFISTSERNSSEIR